MADQEGFIKIDRNMLHWRWCKTPNTAHLFIILLLKANYKDMYFDGKVNRVGSLVTSYQTLSESSGLTIQQCRTALKHLKSTGEVTTTIYPKYQVITIVNYKKYQSVTSMLAGNQQASNRQVTGKQQQEKERKKGRRKEIPPKSPTGGLAPSRGTDEFRNKSHLLLKEDEGTLDDIPMVYRDGTYQSFDNFADYWRWRNQ